LVLAEIRRSAKPEAELILTIAAMEKNIFNVKYLESGERYDVGQTKSDRKPPMGFRLAP